MEAFHLWKRDHYYDINFKPAYIAVEVEKGQEI